MDDKIMPWMVGKMYTCHGWFVACHIYIVFSVEAVTVSFADIYITPDSRYTLYFCTYIFRFHPGVCAYLCIHALYTVMERAAGLLSKPIYMSAIRCSNLLVHTCSLLGDTADSRPAQQPIYSNLYILATCITRHLYILLQ